MTFYSELLLNKALKSEKQQNSMKNHVGHLKLSVYIAVGSMGAEGPVAPSEKSEYFLTF